MIECHCDFESASDVDLRTRGQGPYFASPNWTALILCYAIGDGPIQEWVYTDVKCPEDLAMAIRSGCRIVAHNAAFERHCFDTLADRQGWPRPDISQYACTMATASALGLPRSLDKLGDALGLSVVKDKRGKKLINFFCAPHKGVFNDPAEHPAMFREFVKYCVRDTETEMAAARRMIPLSDAEQAVYTMSEVINSRGVRFDRRSAIAAIALVEKAKAALDARMREVTGNKVASCSAVAQLTAWCEAQGVAMDGVAKDDIVDALEFIDLPDAVRTALTLRQEAAKSSTSKLKAFIKHADDDDRLRNIFVYHGAAPGRWTSAGGVNLANMPRPRPLYKDADLDTAILFDAFRSEEPDLLRTLYGPVMGRPLDLVSDAIRSFLWAAPGHDFIAVDYSGIQNVLGAWLANEEWKLEAMRGILVDPKLPDMYRRAAARILNMTVEVITKKHAMRQAVGKTSELSMQFAGGIVALVKMAKNYNMRLRDFHDLFEPIREATAPEMFEKAAKRWEKAMKSRDHVMSDIMSREAWIVCELIKLGWRATNPAIVASWGVLEDAMFDAIRNPGRKVDALKVTYLYAHGALRCRLPSNRVITYNAPKLKDQVWAKIKLLDGSWTTESEIIGRAEAEVLERRGEARIESATRQAITALGVDAKTKKLQRHALYGGLAFQNLCLGIESDILRIGMRNMEKAGYPVCLHVYDEAVAEVPRGFGSVDEAIRLMMDLPEIYADLPLGAAGWRAKRYFKD